MSSLYICFSSFVWLNLIAVLWFLGFRSYEHVLYTFLRKIISAFFPNIVTDVATTVGYPVLEFRVWQEAGTSPKHVSFCSMPFLNKLSFPGDLNIMWIIGCISTCVCVFWVCTQMAGDPLPAWGPPPALGPTKLLDSTLVSTIGEQEPAFSSF